MKPGERFLILGGGGMIGRQVVHEICHDMQPQSIIVWSLFQKEVRETIDYFRQEFPHVSFVPYWGDMFLRAEWSSPDRQGKLTRAQLLNSPEHRTELYEDLFGDFTESYHRSRLVQIILEHRPDVLIDTVNTATGISYQDIYKASDAAKRQLEVLSRRSKGTDGIGLEENDESRLGGSHANPFEPLSASVEKLLIAQSVPQLIRHVLIMHRAMTEAGTRLYLKVGTTGTGGMGLNIPYTHSEDKPSATLMTKTAIAFAHTGLLFLMARTPGGPVVKEVKPGAMVGYANVTCRKVHQNGKTGDPVYLFETQAESLGNTLTLKQSPADYEKLQPLEAVVVDTGENGFFTRGEFEAITHIWQMEFITPEEIAQQVALEIKGSNTGYDVIAAIDSAVMNPTYRAGYLRQFALRDVARLEHEKGVPSVALGQLGPPELGKLLWEAHLLKTQYSTLEAVLERTTYELSTELLALVQDNALLRHLMAAVGLPILMPEGKTLLRGPFIRIPELPNVNEAPLTPENIDIWANKGWIDLREKNLSRWHQRCKLMLRSRQTARGRGSAAMSRDAYLSEEIHIGAVVGWIFNNEEGGYRIK